MRSLLAALAIVAGACVAFGPDNAEARLNAKRDCTTPKFETPVQHAPPVVQYAPAPVPLQQIVTPPTYTQTPDTTVTIPGQTVTFTTPPQTVVIPGTRVEVPGTVQTFQAPVIPYAQPICPDVEEPKRTPLKTFLEQRKLKREKHKGMEEPVADEQSRCKGGKCKKKWRWEEPEAVVV